MTDRAGEPQSKRPWQPPDNDEDPAEEAAESRTPHPSPAAGGPVTQSKFGPSQASGSFPVPASPAPPPPAPAPAVSPRPLPPQSTPAAPAAAAAPDEEEDGFDEPARRPTVRELLRRITPAMAVLTVGSIGSALFLLRAVTSHTTPVAVLMSAGVVTALIFLLDTVILTAATYRESSAGESGRAFGLALLGGISAVICALALAGTLIMILVLNS